MSEVRVYLTYDRLVALALADLPDSVRDCIGWARPACKCGLCGDPSTHSDPFGGDDLCGPCFAKVLAQFNALPGDSLESSDFLLAYGLPGRRSPDVDVLASDPDDPSGPRTQPTDGLTVIFNIP